jgi:putative ABC transport system permease protein
MRAFGWQGIMDKNIQIGDRKIQVVGLIKDFNFETLQNEVAPTLHFHRTASNRTHRYITVNVVDGKTSEVVNFIESKWTALDASDALPFNYYLLEDTIDRIYQNEDQLLTMIQAFSFVILAVACLGLYGLSSFTMEKKKREIGIRKVLGASLFTITRMFFQKYILLFLVSFAFAIPISLYLMNEWLSGYAKHISLSSATFLISFLAIVVIASATIISKILQVASSNPAAIIKEDS